MNYCTKVVALVLCGLSISNVGALTDKEVAGYSVASGVVVGAVAGLGVAYGPLHNDPNRVMWSLCAGGITGGLTGLLSYWILSQYTPQARLKAAQKIVQNVRCTKLAQDIFKADDALFDYASKTFNVRWPIALAHESSIAMLETLRVAASLLHLASQDTVERGLLGDIQSLAAEIDSLELILKKHVRILQTHKQYDIQVVLLEGFRREQRMEQEAQQRHREAMARQDALMMQQRRQHEEAMKQQRELLGGTP